MTHTVNEGQSRSGRACAIPGIVMNTPRSRRERPGRVPIGRAALAGNASDTASVELYCRCSTRIRSLADSSPRQPWTAAECPIGDVGVALGSEGRRGEVPDEPRCPCRYDLSAGGT